MKKSELIQLIKESYQEILKEENELIKTQGLCKNAMFILKKEINPILEKLLDNGFIKSFDSKVKIWNSGYQIKFDLKNDCWNKYRGIKFQDIPEVEQKISRIIDDMNMIYLQPTTFFEETLEKGTPTRLEGKIFQINKNQTDYPYFEVNSKQDIPKKVKEYIEIIRDQIKEIDQLLNT